MSVGFPFFDPRPKPLDTNGLQQAGCYYCFFATGTLTPTNVYADGGLNTPLSQPTPGSINPGGGTVADSAGRFSVMYLDPSTTYRAQLYSAAGVLLEDTDPIKIPGSPNVSFPNGTAGSPGIAFSNFLSTGLYIPSSNSLGFSTNGIAAGSISQGQQWSIPGAAGGNTLTVAASGNNYAGAFNGSSGAGTSFGLKVSAGTNSSDVALLVQNQTAGAVFAEIFGDGHGNVGPNATNTMSWDTSGHFTWATPSAGGQSAFTFNGRSGNNVMAITQAAGAGNAFGVVIQAGTNSSDYALDIQQQGGGTVFLRALGTGEVFIQTPSAANSGPSGTFQAGYIDEPPHNISVTTTIALTDRGKAIIASGTAGNINLNVPDNSSIAFPVGTIIRIINLSSHNVLVTMSGTTDTLTWYPNNTTVSNGGQRTMGVASVATIEKVGTTAWIITGLNIS